MIFLDNASTTQVDDKYFEIFKNYQSIEFFNPSALYQYSIDISKKITKARKDILNSLGAIDGNIIFTSSGSESNNTVIKGIKLSKNSNIIISNAEHPSVLNSALYMQSKGYDVRIVPVNKYGQIEKDELIKYIDNNTSLISIIHVNNETGAINDIETLCKESKKINPNIIFHSDGVQAVGKIKVNLNKLGVDLYSFSGHKIYVPKGIAGLYYKDNVYFTPLIHGGGQEFNKRSSTENVGGILSFASSIYDQNINMNNNLQNLYNLRNDLIDFFINNTECIITNTPNINSQSPYILCISLKYIKGEVLLHILEKYDICIGTGSACSSKKKTSRLAEYIGLTKEYKNGIIRISFSSKTSKSDIEYFKNCFKKEYIDLLNIIK